MGSLLVVVYPLYNVVKRLKLHGNYFAWCSFFNNGLEWAMGFFLGLSFGTLFTEVEAFDQVVLRAKTADLGDIAREQAWDALEGTRSVAGLLLLLVTARSAFQLWRTWDSWPEGLHRVRDRSLDEELSSLAEDLSPSIDASGMHALIAA